MTLHEDSVVESWSVLVPDASGEGPGIFVEIEDSLEAAEVPGLSWEAESISTGVVKGLAGGRRDALVISYAPLPEWQVAVLPTPFGNYLHLTWVLTIAPRLSRDVRRAVRLDRDRARRFEIGAELDALSRMDLAAFVSLTRKIVKAAVDSLGFDEGMTIETATEDAEPLE